MVRKMRAWDAAPAERDLMKLLVEKVENRVGGRSGSKIQREIKRVLSTHAKADGWLEAPTLARAPGDVARGPRAGRGPQFLRRPRGAHARRQALLRPLRASRWRRRRRRAGAGAVAGAAPGERRLDVATPDAGSYHNPVQVQRATGGSDVDVERAKALKAVLSDELGAQRSSAPGPPTTASPPPSPSWLAPEASPRGARVLGGLTPVRVRPGRPGAEPAAAAVAYFPPTRTVLFACGSSVVVDDLDEDDGQRVYCGHAEAVGCVAAHATPVACSGDAGAVHVWRLKSLEVLQVLGRGLFRGVRHVAFLGGHALAAAGADGGRDGLPFLAVFDSETGDVLGEHLVSCGRGGSVLRRARHACGRCRGAAAAAVLSAGDDGAVRRWAGAPLSAQGDCAIVASKRPASADAAAAAGAAVAGVVRAA
ncbi:hypothetical protein JL721_12346 [Aureococcus anophagefferens]|nr:hypothetical protein JL721_12346 [Aureococcus anophagefferens]